MFSYWAKPEDTVLVARFLNDHIAGICKKHPKRFVGEPRQGDWDWGSLYFYSVFLHSFPSTVVDLHGCRVRRMSVPRFRLCRTRDPADAGARPRGCGAGALHDRVSH